ncbi:hypothetical protein Tco_0429184 [Tanacetum coccineum]
MLGQALPAGSGIPSLVGDSGSKDIKCGAGSSLSASSALREGDRGDPDFRSLLYRGRIPIICSLSGEGDKGEGLNLFDEVFSTWMAFERNTRDLGSFGEETDKTLTLHQFLEEVVHTKCGDGVTSFKRRCDMEDKEDNPSPQNTPQVLPSIKVYTPPVTYSEEVDETIEILREVEPLDHTKLEDLGLNTCNHDIPLSSREFPSVDEPEPQPLPNIPPLDVNLGEKRGTDPPYNPK